MSCRLFIVIVLPLTLVNVQLSAQVSMVEFLQSAITHPDLRTFDDQIAYLDTKPYRLSPLQKLEVRTQNRELLTAYQQYGLRVTPANPWEVKSNNQYFKDFRTLLQLERQITLKELLAERYSVIIQYLYATELRALLEQRQQLMSTQLSILERQLGSSYFDADRYVDLKIDHLTQTVALEETDVEISDHIYQVERLYPEAFKKTLNWDYTKTISVEKIQMIADSISAASIQSTQIAYRQQRINVAQREYNLKKSNINLGFLQTSYDHRRVEQERNPMVISLGFTIPITNPNKGDMTKRQLEVIEAQYDLEETKREDQTDRAMAQDKLSRLLVQFKNLQIKIMALETGGLSSTLTTLKNEDPLVKVKFSENLIKLKMLAVRLQRSIRLTYIQYLSLADFLQVRPLTNYLSEDLEKVTN
jgi:hypothetical protein